MPEATRRANADRPAAAWRRYWLLAAAVFAVLVGYGVGRNVAPRYHRSPPTASKPSATPIAADSTLTPRDVVALQLEALQRESGDLSGIAECFALASPLNRQATGPLKRFAAMVAAPPYDVLLRPNLATIGEARRDGDQAVVTVAIVSRTRGLHVFRFLLSRQTQPPYADCWMTDAVYLAAIARHRSPGPEAAVEAPI